MLDVSIVIPTYGDPSWRSIAMRAVMSAANQSYPADRFEVVRSHEETLQNARNFGAERADGEWLIFLDADDELDPLYVEKMMQATGDIRRPATLGVVDGVEDDEPVMIPRKDIYTTNFVVIGAMCRREDFFNVGGFGDYEALEDWDLWLRMVEAGAEIVDVPEAIYRVHVTPGSRNMNVHAHHAAYRKIRKRHARVH